MVELTAYRIQSTRSRSALLTQSAMKMPAIAESHLSSCASCWQPPASTTASSRSSPKCCPRPARCSSAARWPCYAPIRRSGSSRRPAACGAARFPPKSSPTPSIATAVATWHDWSAAPLGDGLRPGGPPRRRRRAVRAVRRGARRGRQRRRRPPASASSRIRRLETILEITHAWRQTNSMEALLKAMAEAATELLAADRASIFLWDRAAQGARRPARAGREGQRAAHPRRHRASSARSSTPASRAASAAAWATTKSIARSIRPPATRRARILCVPLRGARRRMPRRLRSAQQARRPLHRRGRARPDRAGRPRRGRACRTRRSSRSCSPSTSSWSSRRPRACSSSARARPSRPCARRSAASPTPTWRS